MAAPFPARISREAEEFVYVAFHTCLNCREIRLLAFLRLGYKAGPAVMHMLADETIAPLFAAVRHAQNRGAFAQRLYPLCGLRRIAGSHHRAQNRVLPLLAGHFAGRYSACPILIFDETHAQALVAEGGQWRIAPLANFTPPPPGAKEREIRALWRAFYDAIAIEGRRNERCRMSHMPQALLGAYDGIRSGRRYCLRRKRVPARANARGIGARNLLPQLYIGSKAPRKGESGEIWHK